ncbi:S8 family peptidase [Parabacteroides bouchesdurhonensis]|uniref:S8 family peptidase n=1 Tax=Parabacteroides bouchesdurhonensis TaxID=1936995 RepID=UPI000E4CBA94|nr:S8 family serine peptidase [Parabacteroides bouchesdurhonensis]RHJ92939.1 peptidase S8 [Bacteroides sp. AM07-16]
MNKYIILLFLNFVSLCLYADEGYCFRIYLKDKGPSGYSLDKPEAYLSGRAIERRIRQGKEITVSDLPISSVYLDSLSACGGVPVVVSKWFSTVVIACSDSSVIEQLKKFSFVDSVKWVWKGDLDKRISVYKDSSRLEPSDSPLKSYYGYAEEQIKMLNGIKLHDAGYRGMGMEVAVIDAGFMNVDRISVFDSLNLLGTRNFVFPGESVFEDDDHGTKVLSCLAANAPGIMVGTAPDASYWLIKSEDSRSEYPIEEDYWAAAVEFADSVGVDAISSSLGYFTYDVSEMEYSPSALDGKTAFISRAAHKAAEKGILVFCSAGNEGNGYWEKITFPSDASDIVTVGAVTEKKKKSIFSSIGLTADYRVKPDVVALGSGCCVISTRGDIHYANGTSFSTPILAGLGICLWQAFPDLNNKNIIEMLQQSASQYKRPDAELGYGIPDVYKAYKLQKKHIGRRE